MATQIIKTTFKLRRGLHATWIKNNPILADGEPGFELDTGVLKIGNGETKYIDLPTINGDDYEISADGQSVTLSNHIISLYGFDTAKYGQMPIKGESGTLTWVDSSASIEFLTEAEIKEICK